MNSHLLTNLINSYFMEKEKDGIYFNGRDTISVEKIGDKIAIKCKTHGEYNDTECLFFAWNDFRREEEIKKVVDAIIKGKIYNCLFDKKETPRRAQL